MVKGGRGLSVIVPLTPPDSCTCFLVASHHNIPVPPLPVLPNLSYSGRVENTGKGRTVRHQRVTVGNVRRVVHRIVVPRECQACSGPDSRTYNGILLYNSQNAGVMYHIRFHREFCKIGSDRRFWGYNWWRVWQLATYV